MTYHPQKGVVMAVLKFLLFAVMQRVARVRQRELSYLFLGLIGALLIRFVWYCIVLLLRILRRQY